LVVRFLLNGERKNYLVLRDKLRIVEKWGGQTPRIFGFFADLW